MSTESLATGPTSIDERDSAHLYRVLADEESDERLSGVYRRLAKTVEKHLRFWEERLREASEAVPEHRVGWRSRVLGWLARRFGPQFVLPTIDAMEQAEETIRKGLQTATSEPYQRKPPKEFEHG